MKTLYCILLTLFMLFAGFAQTNNLKTNNKLLKGTVMDNVSPNIFVKDMNKSIEFYKTLGFNLVSTVPDSGDVVFALMNCGSVVFMFQTFASLGSEIPEISRNDGGSLLLYIQMKNIKEYFESVKDKVLVLKGIEKTFYGTLEFSIKDVNGYVLTFAEEIKQ